MAREDRRERERSARRRLIITAARQLAEAEGWNAVTTRRLSTEIEYSQPVLYKHFTSMEHVADAVALEGFVELAEALRTAGAAAGDQALARVAHAYLDFARDNPALYDAMFTRTTSLRFAADDTPPPLTAAFNELSHAIAVNADRQDPGTNPDTNPDTNATLTEVFWAALHGLATLSLASRLRADHDADRLALLIERFTGR